MHYGQGNNKSFLKDPCDGEGSFLDHDTQVASSWYSLSNLRGSVKKVKEINYIKCEILNSMFRESMRQIYIILTRRYKFSYWESHAINMYYLWDTSFLLSLDYHKID